ncbi:MAG: YggS family pyridoxal phosphate-dependent enzyme [Phycisphaerales bacterium]|nr:YggS family pyridoxal phosphate-dependent enzyme [Phycisphaerales bacterium]
MTTPITLEERYHDVKARIAHAAERALAGPDSVILVAVTKYAEPEQIRKLVELGQIDFGENRVQTLIQRVAMIDEFVGRHRTLSTDRDVNVPPKVRWHMIGPLQRNKIRKVIDLVQLIHSIDTLRIAEDLQVAVMKQDEPVDVLIQVNASGERGKHGLTLPAALHVAELIDTMVHLRLRGIMTMAPYSENPEEARPTFERGRELFDEIKQAGIGGKTFNILSMGMSGDYEVAIEEGANVVRIGSAIFGQTQRVAQPTASRSA